MSLPILYSFRRCPYAMRARLALAYCFAENTLELREIVLKNKPQSMLDASPKGTVPVFIQEDGIVLEESLDIMQFALQQNEAMSNQLYFNEQRGEIDQLIEENDGDFKWALDRYKYADRYEEPEIVYRKRGEIFLAKLETRLSQNAFLMGNKMTLADLAVFPFVRQFAHVNKKWFTESGYTHLIKWLDQWLESDVFTRIMKKYKPWQHGDAIVYFPEPLA